ncbi:MAG: phosphatase PAP2 family protein [Culicoidibacterales bacterium]
MELFSQWDHFLQQFIAQFRFPVLDEIAKILDVLGGDVLLYVILLFLLLIPKKTRRLALLLIISVIVTTLMVTVTKVLIGRPRPFVAQKMIPLINVEKIEYYVSFPSGHTAAVASLGAMCWLYYKRYLAIGLSAILIMAWSRIYLYMHYPIDTFIGALIGIGISYAVYKICNKIDFKKSRRRYNGCINS